MPRGKIEQPIFAQLEKDLADDILFAIYQSFTDGQLLGLLEVKRRKEELVQVQTLAVILIREVLSWEELSQLEQQLLINFLTTDSDPWEDS